MTWRVVANIPYTTPLRTDAPYGTIAPTCELDVGSAAV
jgi:hypothetical protein